MSRFSNEKQVHAHFFLLLMYIIMDRPAYFIFTTTFIFFCFNVDRILLVYVKTKLIKKNTTTSSTKKQHK